VGKIQHLQGFGKLDQAPDVVGNHLFRAEGEIDGEISGESRLASSRKSRERRRAIRFGTLKTLWASLQATRLVWSLWVTAMSMSASSAPALRMHRRRRAIADHRAQVEAVLQLQPGARRRSRRP
jgi:hypothetical protein